MSRHSSGANEGVEVARMRDSLERSSGTQRTRKGPRRPRIAPGRGFCHWKFDQTGFVTEARLTGQTYCFRRASARSSPSLSDVFSCNNGGKSSSTIYCVAPFLRSGVIHPKLHLLNIFAVSYGFSFTFLPSTGNSSSQSPISGPKHSSTNATALKAPMTHFTTLS